MFNESQWCLVLFWKKMYTIFIFLGWLSLYIIDELVHTANRMDIYLDIALQCIYNNIREEPAALWHKT